MNILCTKKNKNENFRTFWLPIKPMKVFMDREMEPEMVVYINKVCVLK